MEHSRENEFKRWARFGVDQDGIKYIPVGGTCVMTYLLDVRGSSILAGLLDGDAYGDYLRSEWGIYIHREGIWRDKWFVPSGFLHYGEHPFSCAERIVKNMLDGNADKLELLDVVSFTQPSKYYPGYNHWHICFIYRTHGLKFNKRPWFKRLEYVDLSTLKSVDVGVAGGPVLKKLNLVSD
ncbi:MAG: NUDIX hydrolase [Candidatus Caldarchaeum sp.]|nr:NUDIX domain-containing protein [Candidatus Caldarchaeum sp.]MDW7977742.1 NUDIX hydrolase [Candidatus Caldarchaeum sp.]MDW8359072.1 NUDIX hydrolase [Candidatus Caldarchaeum sp.]